MLTIGYPKTVFIKESKPLSRERNTNTKPIYLTQFLQLNRIYSMETNTWLEQHFWVLKL